MRAGWFSDPECARTSYRRRYALGILKLWGGGPETLHHPEGRCQLPRVQRVFSQDYSCDYRCTQVYPEWVTDEVIQAALNCAHTIQTQRGAFFRGEARKKLLTDHGLL